MKTTMMMFTIAAAAAAMTGDAGAATPVLEAPYMVADSPVDGRLARADSLQREAEALFADAKQWSRAARLLEESAKLRPSADPAAYEAMFYAGRLHWASGESHAALYAFEEAAGMAMVRGDIAQGAAAYVDAAFAAAKSGLAPEARRLLRKAEGLAQSPELSDIERRNLAARINGANANQQLSANR